MKHSDAVTALASRTPAAQRAVLAALPPEYHPPDTAADIYTIGFECELANRPSGLLTELRNAGLTNAQNLHGYHCRCVETCSSQTIDIHPQEDGTCRGELISRILNWLTPETSSIFERLGQVLIRTGTNPLNQAGVNGFHVHVGKPPDWSSQDHNTLVHIFAAYQRDISQLAAQWRPRVRRYNTPISHEVLWNETASVRSTFSRLSKGFWLSDRGHTYEFRMWNGVQSGWRMRMNVGVSVAFLRAARAHPGWRCSETVTAPLTDLTAEPGYHGSNIRELPVAKRGAGGFLDVVGPHMDDVVLADVLRQLDDRSKVDA